MPALYVDEETGREVITHSLLKSMGRCPRQTLYKYYLRLKPKVRNRPLSRGNWMHSLLEAYYSGEDWLEVHKGLSYKFGQLFEEERENLGDLPNECKRLMQSYLWYYRKDKDWKVLEVEYTLECDLPSGQLYRGRVDMMVMTPYGIYIVDHKTHKTLPGTTFRMQDIQSALYIWAARENGIDVQGFIWNYIQTSAIKPIRFNQNGSISKSGPPHKGQTDYLTAKRSIIQHGDDPKDYRDILESLKKIRYDPEKPSLQLSPFFRRETLEKDSEMIKRILKSTIRTAKRTRKYDFTDRDAVERVYDRSCEWMCSYKDLCVTELFGGNSQNLLRQQFVKGDPLDYYQDTKERTDNA